MDTTRILNIDALLITEQELLKQLHEGVLITPNLDHMVKLQKDYEFYRCYQEAEWVVCDSRILWLCSKLLEKPFPEPIPGSSFFTHFYEYHKDDPNCKIFLLGAMDGVALKAQERINAKVGRSIVVGAYSPSYGFEKKEQENHKIYKMIEASGANVVLVGVGAPKQEKWIMAHKGNMPSVKIWMALGATIDFEAGQVKRAPTWMRHCALEWFYRLLQEPLRMFKRYICNDLVFFVHFAKQLWGIYKDPFAKSSILP
ncbi:MAG: WecB/TagA/CpsF family glycosyltransferase [Bacteroidaceae bacterium]|nr:WecB/TagA/CpsF family glycosyltransferase [Bacteroidaceae bacterium]